MTSPYWAKLWIEILDDKKVADMPDWLFRRFIFFVLAAKEYDHDGLLQPVKDLAWRIRTSVQETTDALSALEKVGVTRETAEGWVLVNFKKRQVYEDSTNAERQRRFREKHRNGNITTKNNDNTSVSVSSSDSLITLNDKTMFTIDDGARLICEVARWISMPTDWMDCADIVLDMLQHYGIDESRKRLVASRDDWISRKRKENGANYKLSNKQWINNAMSGERVGAPPPMTSEELNRMEYEKLVKRSQ